MVTQFADYETVELDSSADTRTPGKPPEKNWPYLECAAQLGAPPQLTADRKGSALTAHSARVSRRGPGLRAATRQAGLAWFAAVACAAVIASVPAGAGAAAASHTDHRRLP